MKKPSIERILELQELLNTFASIERIVHVKRHGTHVQETDTEHSYNLAMTAWFLADYFSKLNKAAVIRLALVHDLVEIHAGDTFAYGEQAMLDSKAAREAAAQKQLATDWKDFPDMHHAITEYEVRQSPEACFVYALDKIMPMMAIYLNEGHSWHKHDITLERVKVEKLHKIASSPEIAKYWDALCELLEQRPDLIPPR